MELKVVFLRGLCPRVVCFYVGWPGGIFLAASYKYGSYAI